MSDEQIEPLSERELELVRLLGQGLSNREIARELVISPNTVKVHLRNIYAKLKVSSRTEATMLAVRLGWIEVTGPQEQATGPDQEGIADQEPATAGEQARPQTLQGTPPQPPLALWKRIYLIACLILVALGLWLTWPDSQGTLGPFTDRPVQAVVQPAGSTSRWKALAQMPTPRARLAAVAFENQIVAIAGEAISGVSGIVEIYMPDADDWKRGADKPTPVANVGAVVLDDVIYVPGGSTAEGQVSDRLEVYDLKEGDLGAWSTKASMPKGISAYAIAAYDGALYLFGGWDGSSYIAQTFKYDPQTDAWSSLAPMTVPRAFAGAGAIRDRIYVVGGYDGKDELDTCQVYDPTQDSWSQCPSMNALRGGVGVAVIADTLYVIGGGWQSYLVENEHLTLDASSGDPAQGTWRTFPSPLLQEWRNLGVAANGTFIYAMGGWDGEFLAVNQAYRALFRFYLPSTTGQGSGSSN